MVDFSKRLSSRPAQRPTNPIEIYDTLDRQSDKGPLRPAQIAVLQEWYEKRRGDTDVILKLHTGQGKTLIGLLALQSQLNAGVGPALYLCPNRHLVRQTCKQAQDFGVSVVEADPDLPEEFLNSKAILVTSVQKLFNGLTRFGLGSTATPVGSIVVDDAHACIDAIRDAFTIDLPSTSEPYKRLLDLFAEDLEHQGAGTLLDIRQSMYGAVLPVPYWTWSDRISEVRTALSAHSGSERIRFTWPLLRDRLLDCQCVVGGRSLEIAPYLPPLHEFRSYTEAKHRLFMSATITDDSFLVKGLGLSPSTILTPLVYKDETWFGEKMILLPSSIDKRLDRDAVISMFAKHPANVQFGIVVLVPSFGRADDWKKLGATVAKRDDIGQVVESLRAGDRENTIVVANRYDGIDLPDASCRLLVFDSLPLGETLIERYQASCRVDSDELRARTARSIEQGLGRSVRGEKDYCVFVLTGGDLIKFVQTGKSRDFFSDQTRCQIEIGLDVAKMAAEEKDADAKPSKALFDVINQCLRRDASWKDFYAQTMNAMAPSPAKPKMLALFAAERDAELRAETGQTDGAVAILQKMMDQTALQESERAWYVQEMARYRYRSDKVASNKLQHDAFQKNTYLLRPKMAAPVAKPIAISQTRGDSIIGWLKKQGSWSDVSVVVADIVSRLQFGVEPERFEAALNDLGHAIGFDAYRPEKETKEGPDNLWRIQESQYVLIECKNGVDLGRDFVKKEEAGQISTSAGWFTKNYPDATVVCVMITPAKRFGPAAFTTMDLYLLRPSGLKHLTDNVTGFFNSLQQYSLADLNAATIQQALEAYRLGVKSIPAEYVKRVNS